MIENRKNGLKKMIVDSVTKFRIDKYRLKEGYLSSGIGTHVSNSDSYPQNKYQNTRPLKTSNSNLSFKGLSFMPKLYKSLEKKYAKDDFLKFTNKYLGNMGEELLKDILFIRRTRTNKLISFKFYDGNIQAKYDSLLSRINTTANEAERKSLEEQAQKLFDNNNYEIDLNKKTIPHLALDGILYPFKILPADILNGTVELLGKLPFLKSWSKRTLEHPLFKNIRQRSKIDAKVNSLVGLLTYRDEQLKAAIESYEKIHKKTADETIIAKLKKEVEEKMGSSVFQSEMKMFDPKTGNYDTKHERALNRLVSGLPPAIFLANDAYNLSRMMDDDSKSAEKERKIRFKQETSRILTSGYLTLITMGAFQKFINKSKLGIVLLTGTTVLITEMFSRLSNGKHITRLTPEEAREENRKMHAPEAEIKPQEAQKNNQISSTGNKPETKQKEQKPLLSFDTLMKGSAIILGLGYGIKGLKNIPAIRKAALNYFSKMSPEKSKKLGVDIEKLEEKDAVKTFEDKVIYRPFTQLYKKLTSEKYIVSPQKFNLTVETLKKNGFTELAKKYEEVGNTTIKYMKNGRILNPQEVSQNLEEYTKIMDFGTKDKAIKPLVNFIIAPFKFMWNTITLPYWMVDEKIMSVFRKAKPKSAPKDIDALAKSFEKISKKAVELTSGKMTEEKFKDYIQINLLKAFNFDSMSSVSNAELSNLAKTAASIATIWFLMTDNYNMVMLKSNGNDKDGANTKFKERFVQEGSRLFYQTLLIDLFNSTFRNSYNGSLLGMSWVTLADTTLGEMLTRSSVGIPIKPHTRDELINIEAKQNNSTGLMKKYYNFMQRLTGKRSIKSYEVSSTGKGTPQSLNTNIAQNTNTTSIEMNKKIMFSSNSILDQMIKG